MRELPRVTLLKSGNRLVIDPASPEIEALLVPKLTFQVMILLKGPELKKEIQRANRDDDKPRRVRFEEYECYGFDHRGRIGTSFGFWKRCWDLLRKAGYRVVMRDMTPHPRPEVFEPRFDRLEQAGIKLRHGQDQFLCKLIASRCGRFGYPTGYGKTFLAGLAGLLLPKARIDIVSRSASVVRDRIYPELCSMLPDVGIVGGGKNKPGHRIMCYTIDSMHKAPANSDYLFGDESHQFAADKASASCGRWDMSRNFGFSATHDMRIDKKDFRSEAIFGPLLCELDYSEAEKHRLVSAIEVRCRNVIMTSNPCEGETDVDKERLAYWLNDYRNDLIAEDAVQADDGTPYDDDTQVLVYCATLIHAVQLKARLPHFDLVYAEGAMTRGDRRRWTREKLLSPDEPIMTPAWREKLTNDFEHGRRKRMICTTVFNAGVNFPELAVLVRADGGSSPIGNTQIPGRATRRTDTKSTAIVRDYLDQFDRGCRQKATNRLNDYKAHGWKIVLPGLHQTSFPEFED